MEFAWRVGPYCRLSWPSCSPQKACRPQWLAVFVPPAATEAPAIVANFEDPTRATGRSKLEVESTQVK